LIDPEIGSPQAYLKEQLTQDELRILDGGLFIILKNNTIEN